MLRKAIVIALMIVLFIGGLPAQAQTISPAVGDLNAVEAPQSSSEFRSIVQEETNTLRTQLNLTREQQREGRRILERSKATQNRLVQAIQSNPDNRALVEQLQAHQIDTIQAFQGILNPDQKSVFEASLERTQQRLVALEPNEASGPVSAGFCRVLCELACLLLPPGPICDCSFCDTITSLPIP